MALSRSLAVGSSSLKAHQSKFDVISNNLANASTVGYKSNRANFAEQFNQIYTEGKSPDESNGNGVGGVNPLQFGLGVKLGSIQQDMGQGVIESTNRPLDLALEGEGFFVYNVNGEEKYSRAGAISHDTKGFLVDSNTGAFLQGYNIAKDATGKTSKDSLGTNLLNSKVENLKISKDTISEPKQTQNINLSGNINSAMAVGETRKTSQNVYDSTGGVHSLELTFTKNATANEYAISGTIDNKAVTLSTATLTFNSDGTINQPLSLNITAADLNTAVGTNVFDATSPKDFKIELAKAGALTQGLTQYAMPSSASFQTQDGYKLGQLEEVAVDSEGKIHGSFSNGKSELLGQVVIAKFTNQEGMIRDGNNFYSASPNSGTAHIGTAGDIFGSTSIQSNALEQSNVDLTTQFVDMISTQRAFEAASRTVTISDSLLAEINQLKR